MKSSQALTTALSRAQHFTRRQHELSAVADLGASSITVRPSKTQGLVTTPPSASTGEFGLRLTQAEHDQIVAIVQGAHAREREAAEEGLAAALDELHAASSPEAVSS